MIDANGDWHPDDEDDLGAKIEGLREDLARALTPKPVPSPAPTPPPETPPPPAPVPGRLDGSQGRKPESAAEYLARRAEEARPTSAAEYLQKRPGGTPGRI